MEETFMHVYAELADKLIRRDINKLCPQCSHGLGIHICKMQTGIVLQALGAEIIMSQCKSGEKQETFNKFMKLASEKIAWYKRTWSVLSPYVVPEITINKNMTEFVNYMVFNYPKECNDWLGLLE